MVHDLEVRNRYSHLYSHLWLSRNRLVMMPIPLQQLRAYVDCRVILYSQVWDGFCTVFSLGADSGRAFRISHFYCLSISLHICILICFLHLFLLCPLFCSMWISLYTSFHECLCWPWCELCRHFCCTLGHDCACTCLDVISHAQLSRYLFTMNSRHICRMDAMVSPPEWFYPFAPGMQHERRRHKCRI